MNSLRTFQTLTPNQVAVLKTLQNKQRTSRSSREAPTEIPSESDSEEELSKSVPVTVVECGDDSLKETKEFLEKLENGVRRASYRLALRKLIAAGVDKAVQESHVRLFYILLHYLCVCLILYVV